MESWPSIPGETPIDPSGLKIKGITNRAELSVVEAQNIRKAFASAFRPWRCRFSIVTAGKSGCGGRFSRGVKVCDAAGNVLDPPFRQSYTGVK
jgi:hypothetical protein